MRKAMVKRQDDEHDGVARHADDRASLLHIGGVVAVGQQDTLRVCRGAGGVGDIGIVIWLHRLVSLYEGFGCLSKEVAPTLHYLFTTHLLLAVLFYWVKHDDTTHIGTVGKYLANLGQLLLRGDDEAGIGVLNTEEQIARLGQLNAERHIHRTGIEDTQLRSNPKVAPLREQRHALTFL